MPFVKLELHWKSDLVADIEIKELKEILYTLHFLLFVPCWLWWQCFIGFYSVILCPSVFSMVIFSLFNFVIFILFLFPE